MLVKRGFSLKEFLIPYIATLIGCILAAVAITAFFVPHNLLSGGILLQIHGPQLYDFEYRRNYLSFHRPRCDSLPI